MAGILNKKTLGVAGAMALLACSCLAEEYKPERYDLILDRSPFGSDPLAGGALDAANDLKAANQMAVEAAKEIRLCFLFETEGGEIRAGFENMKAKPGDQSNPKNIILRVGESFKGMKLTEINLENSQAVLVRSGKRVLFELSKAPTAAKATPAKQSPRRFGGGFRRPPSKPPVKPSEPQLSPEEQARQRETVRENLRQYQMEVIRTGMPPLPIPLTKDMDDQLVAEGILPPGQ